MKPDECHALWLRHLLEVERATRGLPRVFVSYPALLRDWRSVADAIAVTLDLTWPQPPADAAESVDARLDPRRRHHVAPLGAHDGEALPSWLQAAHRAFERAIGGDGSALAGTLDELHKTVIQTDPVLLRLRLEAQVNELSAELGRTRTALDTALSSNSWKLTRPLRALVETLRRPIRD